MSRAPREHVPPVAKIRIRHAKRGRLRFSSHRDFQRAFERALRRAEVPMAYSSGFNPRPKIAYLNPAPTGVASEAEYTEIGVSAQVNVDALRAALDQALPPGLDVVDAVVAGPWDLPSRLQASCWQIKLVGIDLQTARDAAARLLAAESVEVERMMKSGPRRWDARPLIQTIDAHLSSDDDDRCAILTVVVTHGTPSVRPDDVLAALRQVADLVPPVPPLVTRLAQGPLAADARTVSDPLELDRAGSDPTSADAAPAAGKVEEGF